METLDHVILGAGCAGLSLASRVSGPGRGVLVDPRSGFEDDRTWCFFARGHFGFEAAIAHRYPAWKVRFGGREIVCRVPGVEYVHVASDRFYAEALRRTRDAGIFDVRLGVRARAVRRSANGLVVDTDAGELCATRVFDSRPPRLDGPVAAGEVRLLQHFEGHFVRADVDAFDPSVATLMDFDVPQREGTAFVYVLPTSRREALVEATWFSPSVLSRERYTAVIDGWLRERAGLRRWDVVRTERGVLPMTTESLSSGAADGVVPIGLAGDLAKPSTGYAFLSIQRQSSTIAARLASGRFDGAPLARPRRTAAVDRVFLHWLARHPDKGASLLFSLFERVPHDTLVRFLSDEASAADDLAVMRAVPAVSFGAATARALPSLLRAF